MKFIRGRSLQSLLGRLLLLLALVAVLAALGASALSTSVSRTFSLYTDHGVPLLRTLDETERESQRMSDLLSVLHPVDDTERLRQLRAELLTSFKRLIGLNASLNSLFSAPTAHLNDRTHPDWRATREGGNLLFELRAQIDVETDLITQQLALRQAFSAAERDMVTGVESLVRSLDLASSEQKAGSADNENQHLTLLEMKTLSKRIALLHAQSVYEKNANKLQTRQQSVAQTLREITLEFREVEPEQLRSKLGQKQRTLYDQNHSSANFFELRARYLRARRPRLPARDHTIAVVGTE